MKLLIGSSKFVHGHQIRTTEGYASMMDAHRPVQFAIVLDQDATHDFKFFQLSHLSKK